MFMEWKMVSVARELVDKEENGERPGKKGPDE